MTPEELWKEAARGSQPAWKSLYELFGGKLYQFFLKNTSHPEIAMDLSHEVFLRLFNHRESFVYGSLKTWIFRIAHNLLIDHWRKKGKKVDFFGENAPEIPDPAVNVEEQVLNRLQHVDMVNAIDATLPLLTEEDRLIIGLIYLGGLPIPELASLFGIPLGTAKTRVRQARLRLDKLLMAQLKDPSKESAA